MDDDKKKQSAAAGARWRPKLAWILGLLTLLVSIQLVKSCTKGSGHQLLDAGDRAALFVKPGGPPNVVQVRDTTKPARAENRAYVLSLDQEVFVDVLSTSKWLGQRISELGKADLDPRPKVNLDTVVYDPVKDKTDYDKRAALLKEQDAITTEAKDVVQLPPGQDRTAKSTSLDDRRAAWKTKVDELLQERRKTAWLEAAKQWLQQSCLVLNGHVLPDLHPQVAYGWDEYGGSKDLTDYDHYDALRFKIALTDANKKEWLELLGGIGFGSKPMSVSIAFVDVFEKGKTEIIPTAINPSYVNSPEWQKVRFKASTDWLTWLLLVAFALLLLLFVYYAFKTNLLREMGMDGFWHLSLGSCQMAFWFFIICGCYMFLWIIIGDYNTLTSQELLLIGISAATALSASVIADKQGDGPQQPGGSDLLTPEEMDLDTEAGLNAKAMAEKAKLLENTLVGPEKQRSEQRAGEFARRAAYYRKGWCPWLLRSLTDLASEANHGRPDFYRFQMIGWTLAFGVIFVHAVYYKLAMPEFSNEQLLLMGISSGTYLGFKYKNKPDGKQ